MVSPAQFFVDANIVPRAALPVAAVFDVFYSAVSFTRGRAGPCFIEEGGNL
jgi:hypothetical protein